MLTLDHLQLKKDFAAVFEKYYPQDTADSLAVIHAQYHLQFVNNVADVPVADGDPRRMVKRQAKLARSIQGMRSKDPLAPADKKSLKLDLTGDIMDLLESVGPDNVLSLQQIHAQMAGLQATDYDVRRAILSLLHDEKIVRIGLTKGARYRVPFPPK